MRSFTKALFVFCIFCFLLSQSFAQSTEKIHGHYDKDIYLPGETVWFKAYIYDAGKPSPSTNLYAGWFSKEGKLLKEKKYPIFNGAANGDFEIPDSLVSDIYQLRLFTKRMLQADSSQLYTKSIAVYIPGNKWKTADAAPGFTIGIYPEGGSLVADINNHIAFRILTGGDAGMLQAALLDATDKLIDSVYFDHAGMAKVQFIPKQGNKYFLKWADKNGQQQTAAIPSAEMNGASLHTELTGKDLYYIVQKNTNIPRFNKLRINVQSGKDVLYSALLNLEKTAQVINKLPTDSLPAGLVDISLTDEEGNLLQKKSIYAKNKVAPPSIKVIEKSSLPKGKNIIDITVNDTALNMLSVAIVDEIFYPGNTGSIVDGLLLNRQSAELYQSIGNDKKTDLIVSTAGLQQHPQSVSALPADNYISLIAYMDKRKSLPDKAVLTVIANDKISGKQVIPLNPDKEKNFTTEGLIVYDSAKMYYQLSYKDMSDYISMAEISNLRQPVAIKAAPAFSGFEIRKMSGGTENSFQAYETNRAGKFNETTTLKTVEVKSSKRKSYMARLQELDDRYATGMFKGFARGEAFNVMDDPMADGNSTIYSYLVGKVTGITVRTSGFGGSFMSSRGVGQGAPLAIFIDETVATDDMVASVPLSQVAYIKVINGIVIGSGGSSTSGAIYIYTRKGDDYKSTAPSMNNITIKGYDIPKEFQNPDYSDKASLVNKDYRSTLYWDPYIETGKNNKTVRIEYYNNDVSKKPVLTLKGFNEEGELVEIRKVLE